MNIASLIFRPDLGFLALTSFQSFNRPSLSFGSSSNRRPLCRDGVVEHIVNDDDRWTIEAIAFVEKAALTQRKPHDLQVIRETLDVSAIGRCWTAGSAALVQ